MTTLTLARQAAAVATASAFLCSGPAYAARKALVIGNAANREGKLANQATAFCKWIGGRLPTEEEREYVASGGSEGRTYPWGNDEPGARACWNGEGNELGTGSRKSTCPVGSYKVGDSKWGAHDLAGNVWEYTSSDYDSSHKVLRGGSWYLGHAEYHRARYRRRDDAKNWPSHVGFRCGL